MPSTAVAAAARDGLIAHTSAAAAAARLTAGSLSAAQHEILHADADSQRCWSAPRVFCVLAHRPVYGALFNMLQVLTCRRPLYPPTRRAQQLGPI
jgi:hypothetical protein